jgi:hypothetical protein
MISYSEEIKKGIDFLSGSQTADGNFPGSTFYLESNKWVNSPGTIFSLSVITHCLTSILSRDILKEDQVNKCRLMIKRALGLFIREMKMPGLWKFGVGTDYKWKNLPYDIDDTCCVSHLLKNYHPYIHFGMNKDLILGSRNTEGLFYTWIKPLPDGLTNDIDSVVNVNACMYLGENESTDNVVKYICRIINSGEEKGSYYYYPDNKIFYYMISRAYASGIRGFSECRKKIQENLTAESNLSNVLSSAISAATLLNFNYGEEKYITDILGMVTENQSQYGSWDKYPFYSGGVYPEPIIEFFGSESVSTALCLEAMVMYADKILS